MKLVINSCFGGFSIKESIAKKYGFDLYTEKRNNPQLINLIESGVDCNGMCAKLVVIDVPENATDYIIQEYDGYESILYVVDGKIYNLYV